VFGNAWRVISKDPWILSVVERGFFIDFVSRPLQKTEPPESVMGQQMEAVCAEEVTSLLKKGPSLKLRILRDFSATFSRSQRKTEVLGPLLI
jgi:hypothetical protein